MTQEEYEKLWTMVTDYGNECEDVGALCDHDHIDCDVYRRHASNRTDLLNKILDMMKAMVK